MYDNGGAFKFQYFGRLYTQEYYRQDKVGVPYSTFIVGGLLLVSGWKDGFLSFRSHIPSFGVFS